MGGGGCPTSRWLLVQVASQIPINNDEESNRNVDSDCDKHSRPFYLRSASRGMAEFLSIPDSSSSTGASLGLLNEGGKIIWVSPQRHDYHHGPCRSVVYIDG